MKPLPNLGLMLDKYNDAHFEDVFKYLRERFGSNPKPDQVYDEIARVNGDLAGLGPNNTAADRSKLFSENPVLSYHWTPHEFEEFKIINPETGPWDSLGIHSGTLKAAHDRMRHVNFADNIHQIYPGDLGSIRPLVIDNDNPFLIDGMIRSETQIGITPGVQDVIRNMRDDYFKRKYETDAIYDGSGYVLARDRRDIGWANDDLRSRLFGHGGHTNVPYLNTVEDPGSVSYITPPTHIKSPHARFDPRQFRSGKLLDAKIAAPASMFQLDPEKTKTDNETAREVADFATGFVPVLGSAREAARDFQKGNYGWGAFNSAMAAAEIGIPALAGVKLIKPALAKGAKYFK